MERLELKLPDNTYKALQQAASRVHKSEAELALEAIESYLRHGDSLIGLFADESTLIDNITADIMHSREQMPWRLNESASE